MFIIPNTIFTKNIDTHESILFLLCASAAFTIWLPFKEKSIFLLLAIIAVVIYRDKLFVDKQIKIILALFLAYLLIFTVLSEDIHRSIKGVYDILRGLLLFPIGLMLGILWAKQFKNHFYFLLIASCILFGNFLFPISSARYDYYGYTLNSSYIKPNDISMLFMGLTILSFLVFPSLKTSRRLLFLWPIYIVSGFTLILLAESRGVWVALLSSLLLYALIENRFSVRLRLSIVVFSITIFLFALFFYSHKGLGLRRRDDIWAHVFTKTYENSPFLGFGINYPAIPEINLNINYAHNVALEIYASSGIIGIIFIFILLAYLIGHMLRIQYERNSIYYTGIIGVTAFILLGMVNLRFSSFSFFSSISLFFGLLYSQSINKKHDN